MGLKPCAESSSLFAFEASFSGVTFYKCPNCRGFQPVFSRTTRAAFSKFRPFLRDVSKIGVKTLGPESASPSQHPHAAFYLRIAKAAGVPRGGREEDDTRSKLSRRKLHPSGSALRLLSRAARAPNSTTAARGSQSSCPSTIIASCEGSIPGTAWLPVTRNKCSLWSPRGCASCSGHWHLEVP
jgi:hypothetical protein